MYANRLTISLIMIVSLSACSTIHKQFSIDSDPATSTSLDAKQRLVLVTDKAGPDHNRRAICAEPSPDAMVGLTSSGALEALIPQANASGKVAGSIAETLAQLGERTPTIQLLRDALYRACEAYLNGGFDATQYRDLLYGYDDLVVTLLAIEGITQRPHAYPVIIQGNTKASATDTEGTMSAVTVNNTPPPNPISKEIAAEVGKILDKYYELQKFIYSGGTYEGKTKGKLSFSK